MSYHIGIDLGGTNIAVGITNGYNEIVARNSRKTKAAKSFDALVADIAQTAKETVHKSKIAENEIISVGMGTPSCINPETGLLVNANNLGWRNVPLQKEIEKYFRRPISIANDADCAAIGEVYAGAAQDADSAVMVTLGTGVGGGIVINRRIFSGGDGMGSEIGHTKLVFDGEKCTCGKKGCFEAYASATALISQTKAAMRENKDSILNQTPIGEVEAKTVFDAAHKGDETAIKVIDKYTDYLAAGISTLITLFRPKVLIIGGGISGQGDYLLKPLRKKVFDSTFAAEEINIPEIRAARLGNDAGIIGAAIIGNMKG